jgi:hypothetical protein
MEGAICETIDSSVADRWPLELRALCRGVETHERIPGLALAFPGPDCAKTLESGFGQGYEGSI